MSESKDPITAVQDTLDILNEQIKFLPPRVRPWVEWQMNGYPQVILIKTRYERDRVVRDEG